MSAELWVVAGIAGDAVHGTRAKASAVLANASPFVSLGAGDGLRRCVSVEGASPQGRRNKSAPELLEPAVVSLRGSTVTPSPVRLGPSARARSASDSNVGPASTESGDPAEPAPLPNRHANVPLPGMER